MANAWFRRGVQHIGEADIDLSTAPIYVQLIDTNDWTPDFTITGDETYDDIPVAACVGDLTLVESTTFVDCVLDGDDTTLLSVSGDECEALVLFARIGAEAPYTYYLIGYLDDVAAGLPVTPNGTNILIVWHASGILEL